MRKSAVEYYIDKHGTETDDEEEELLICEFCNNAYYPSGENPQWQRNSGGRDIVLFCITTGRRYCSVACYLTYRNGNSPLPPSEEVKKYKKTSSTERRNALLLLQVYQEQRYNEENVLGELDGFPSLGL